MKNSTALRQSQKSLPAIATFAAILCGLWALFHNWLTATLAIIALFALIGDVVNVIYIRSKLKSDPEYLKKNIPGT